LDGAPLFPKCVHLREANGSWDMTEQTNKEKSTSVIDLIRAATDAIAAALRGPSCCLATFNPLACLNPYSSTHVMVSHFTADVAQANRSGVSGVIYGVIWGIWGNFICFNCFPIVFSCS